MRKHWVGLLSILGLAGSSMPAISQVKGAKVAEESKAKWHKSQVEKNASAQARQDKWKKGAAEVNSAQGRQDKWKKGAAEANSVQSNAADKHLHLKQVTLHAQSQTTQKDKNTLTKAGLTKASLTKASADKSAKSALTKTKSSK